MFGCLTLSFIYFFQTRDKRLDQCVRDLHFQVTLNPGQQWLDWLKTKRKGKRHLSLTGGSCKPPENNNGCHVHMDTDGVYMTSSGWVQPFFFFFWWGLPITSSCPHSHFPVTVTTPGEQTQVEKNKSRPNKWTAWRRQTGGQNFFFINIIVVSGVLSQRLFCEQKAGSFQDY